MEALLAAAAAPAPAPAPELVPDPTLAADLFPEDLPRLLDLLGRADLYLQDEVEVALHPTLTRVWSRCGRPGQRRVQAPGTNAKQYGLGLVDWCDGTLDFELADGRRTLPELLADAQRWAHTITPAQVLSQIGSPFAPDQQPPVGEVLNRAA